MSVDQADFQAVASLMGTKVVVLQPPSAWNGDGGGTDIDCLVSGLDTRWPLRLPSGWKLCQALHYRHFACSWYLVRDDESMHIDTTDDDGLDAVVRLLKNAGDGLPDAVRATYITEKRIRKKMLSDSAWSEIRPLSHSDRREYTSECVRVFGRRAGTLIAECGVLGRAPDRSLWRRARRGRRWMILRNPALAARVAWLEGKRLVRRVSNPTGMYVLVVGPDGSGKSTFAQSLLRSSTDLFRRSVHIHWRPGLLPAPGRVAGRAAGDPSRPHDRPPHGRLLSVALLLYQWLDFWLGGWVRIKATRVRSGLVIVERGWWDIAVDPRRYRLSVPPSIIRGLGRLLPRPDLVVVLTAAPEVLLDRKNEITAAEIERQQHEWAHAPAPGRTPSMNVDTEAPLAETTAAARARLASDLAGRTLAQMGKGWTGITSREFRRWSIPRGPRRVAASALFVHNPVTPRGLVGWRSAHIAARTGLFSLLPRGEAPPEVVRDELASVLDRGDTMAIIRANHPGRFVALTIDPEGHRKLVVKIATDDAGLAALDREASAIQEFGALVAEPLRAPTVLERVDRRLVMEAVSWRPRLRPWQLDNSIAAGLGRFHRAGRTSGGRGAGHGDFAPWNLLATGSGWVLVDWEDATRDAEPYFDLWHFFVQGHALLGRPRDRDLIEGMHGRGWIGQRLATYADAAEIDAGPRPDLLLDYLRTSMAELDPDREDNRRGIEARNRLLAQIGQ